MIYIGIDFTNDKRDYYIISSWEVLSDVFTIANNMDGFELLFQRLKSVARGLGKVKVKLETTDQ